MGPQIALGLVLANSWSGGKAYLATTTKEVVARLTKNWDVDVAAFDEVYLHILRMSDALTDGIVKQFPRRF
jgi:hypothetical protein